MKAKSMSMMMMIMLTKVEEKTKARTTTAKMAYDNEMPDSFAIFSHTCATAIYMSM
jgi:hypothetical protein